MEVIRVSRSVKKNPVVKDYDSGSFGKRLANKRVRRTEEVPMKGKGYRKIFESYNIHDYISYWTKEEAIETWINEEKDRFFHDYEGYFHRQFNNNFDRYLAWWKREMLGK